MWKPQSGRLNKSEKEVDRMKETIQAVWVITGGSIDESWLKSCIEAYRKEAGRLPFLIGVDGGVGCLLSIGHRPDYILGDFDTLDKGDMERVELMGVPMTRLDPIKDMTDTHAVFDWLASNGHASVKLFGFSGTRMDHSLANMLVPFSYSTFSDICYENTTNKIYFHQRPKVWNIDKCGFRYIAIVPIEPLQVIETQGLKYNVSNREFRVYDSYGISNEIEGEGCTIHLGEGKGWIILSND